MTTARESMVGRELRLPEHLSHSQCNAYQHCPRQYVLERGLKVPSRPAWALVGGSAVHEATEEYDKALWDGKDMDDELLHETFDLAFEANTVEQEERQGFDRSEFRASGRASKAHPNKEDAAWWQDNGHAMVRRWKQWRRTSPWELLEVPDENGVASPAIELVFEVDLGDDITVKGAIDRLFTYQGTIGVVDIKSGRPPQSDSQLGLYKLAMEKSLDISTDWGCYWMARDGGTTPPVGLAGFTLERVKYDYSSTRKAIDAKLFPAKVSNMCASCPVRDFCYAVSGSRANEIPLDFSDSGTL